MDNTNDLVEGSTARITTLVDGTLRITIDIEPVSAPKAFLAFGLPGTPVAIAALRVNEEQAR